MPKTSVDFAGPSYFGGQNNELVLCAGKSEQHSFLDRTITNIPSLAGDIFIWDTDSGVLLHHIRAQAHGGDLTSIAWNHAATDPFMFATGSHDGTVRIWTRPPNSPDIPYDDHILDDVGHEDDLFAYGEFSRSSSPHDLVLFRSESPDLEYTSRVKSPRGIPLMFSNSSDSSVLKLR